MNRLDSTFQTARHAGKKLLCPFLTAGYPSLEATPHLLLAAQKGGAGILELGIPFSDPIADGPTIQASFTHALAKGCTVSRALATIPIARQMGLTIPIAVMVSYSIIFKRGTREFAKACADHAADGLILPDIPLEEAPAIITAVREAGLRSTLLIAPTTTPARRAAIAQLCDGFIYYLSISGITGERQSLPADMASNLAALRQITTAPICVGFGISTADHVRQVLHAGADGAIVGSALIRRLAQHATESLDAQAAAITAFVTELAQGLA